MAEALAEIHASGRARFERLADGVPPLDDQVEIDSVLPAGVARLHVAAVLAWALLTGSATARSPQADRRSTPIAPATVT